MIYIFVRRRVVGPILDLLRQGITPEKIALSVAFGLVLGIFPALGSTTLLCFLAAIMFRLNLPALQLVNFLIYPMQLVLLIPFIRAGEILFRSPKLSLSLTQMLTLVHMGIVPAMQALWSATMHAIVVWTALAPLAIYLIYRTLVVVLKRMAVARERLKSKAVH